ncbi:unnamed protein product [Paramecium sonneborni]|uniref:Uncharacterized protein n=1 Tax=Paramecium sonneborni TaxID=65129 RepID=A0A8S1RXP7_9CILI|nr:unnamed protein product [Paramecium sonneborni]
MVHIQMIYHMEKEYSGLKTKNILVNGIKEKKYQINNDYYINGIGWYQGSHCDYYLGQWENGRCFGFCIYMKIYIKLINILDILAILQMILNMVIVKSILRMVIILRENIKMVNLMVMVNFIGIIVIVIRVNLQKDLEFGKVKYKKEQIQIKDNMQMIKNGEKEYLNMLMELNIKVILLMIKCWGYGEIIWQDKAIYKGYWLNGLKEGEGIYEYDTLILKGNWKINQLQTIDNVRVSLNQFLQQHNLKEINENQEIQSQMADEPDQDEIGDLF